jgi:hypothetical protein
MMAYRQLPVDVVDVALDRRSLDEQLAGDRGVVQAARHQAEHLEFAGRQRAEVSLGRLVERDELAHDRRVHDHPALEDRLNHLEQLLDRLERWLEDEAEPRGTAPAILAQRLGAMRGKADAEQHDAHVWVLPLERRERFDRGGGQLARADDDHVGLQRAGRLDQRHLVGGRDAPAHLGGLERSQERLVCLAQQRLLFGDQETCPRGSLDVDS